MASMQKRLQKELLALQNDPPPGMTLNEKSVQNTITQWIVDMEGAPGTLYEGEKFQLLFKFSSRYPFDSPQVSPAIVVLCTMFEALCKFTSFTILSYGPFFCSLHCGCRRSCNSICLRSEGHRSQACLWNWTGFAQR
uniref:Ubiquitin conjugating enzyme E2 Wb n=1 Tax=Amphilophus citrinellus TaxID=61819 RepID=A0A3Q0QPK5_AMPCI